MTDAPSFDLDAAHKHFAGACFNACWALIDVRERTPEQEEEMLRLATASHYHWTQRANYGPKEASVASWQLSRVYALIGEGSLARRFGRRSLEVLEGSDVGAFFVGYAHEALARAASVLGDAAALAMHTEACKAAAESLDDADQRSWLLGDLSTVPAI